MLLFNRYQYEPSTDCIGRGEFSLVFEALDTHIYLPVAVKIYRAEEASEKFGFVNINKFAALDHPNICRYLHLGEIKKESISGENEKRQVCVMELLRDGDFASYYQANRQPEVLRKMVLDILHGLTYLHAQRIVHRRLKPSNLLVGMTTQGPVVKITDFGLGSGKAASRDARFSSMVVEVSRMAPEQLNPKEYGVDGSASYHVDFWALGLAVYEAIMDNDVLFKNSARDSREQVIRNILSPALPEKVRDLPAPFDRFVMRCLAKHAEHRPQNTRELIELLSQPIVGEFPAHKGPFVLLPRREEPVVTTVELGGAEPLEDGPVLEGPVATSPGASFAAAAAPLAAATAATAPVRSVRELHPFFSRYEYNPNEALIGKGGFARVYRAFDKRLNRWVALKFYKTAEVSERCSPTAEILRVINLDHPNICRYIDIEELEKENVFGEREITQVCVMELLDGGNLLEYYAMHPTEPVLKKLLTDVLNGLAYLHRNGIIHRDIKPANILIRETADGPVAKITDFGVSKALDAGKTEHSSALVVSIPYMAPEQLNVKKYGIDERIGPNLDLWALGVTLYEVITGKVLFKNGDHDSNEEIMANILSPELLSRVDALPQPYRDVVRRCLVKDARRRAHRAEDLLEVLHRPVEAAPQRNEERMPQAGEPAVAFIAEPEVEGKPILEIRREMRLIPETGPVTEDLFVPEKSWVWAEAVSAPVLEEAAPASRGLTSTALWTEGMRIAIVAATVLVIIASYIIIQNHRMSEALRAVPVKVDAVKMIQPQRVEAAQSRHYQ
jgi:serine/threonine protein kinase